MQPYYGSWVSQLSSNGGLESMGAGFGFFIVLLIAWSLYWKGRALWRAAQREEEVWFVILLIVNTLGILDILYLYLFSTGAKEKKK